MIEVTNLTKRYGDHIAVDNISFRVEKGKIYGFLGPNGAGKSTTMNIITGYLAATEGTVTINGHDILKEPEEAKKCIGYLPEMPPLYMDMTVREYLVFAAELKKVKEEDIEAQVTEAMEKTFITDMEKRLIKNLSKGYKQRVGLAQAMIGNPEVIILDEPSVGLDPKQIIEIRDLIRSLAKDHTVILSSHILSEVSAVCDHILIIAQGKLVASDSAEDLQKKAGSTRELVLDIRGSEEEVMNAVSTLEYVNSVEKCDDAEENCVKVKIVTDKTVDIREQIFHKLAEANLPIMSLVKVEKTLEDIFLELTSSVERTKVVKKSFLSRFIKDDDEPQEEAKATEKNVKEEE